MAKKIIMQTIQILIEVIIKLIKIQKIEDLYNQKVKIKMKEMKEILLMLIKLTEKIEEIHLTFYQLSSRILNQLIVIFMKIIKKMTLRKKKLFNILKKKSKN